MRSRRARALTPSWSCMTLKKCEQAEPILEICPGDLAKHTHTTPVSLLAIVIPSSKKNSTCFLQGRATIFARRLKNLANGREHWANSCANSGYPSAS